MAFIGSVGAVLRADNSDFRQKMSEAGEAAEELDKKLKKFGLGFGGVALLATWFRETLEHARGLEGSLTENESRAKRFAESVGDIRKGFFDASVSALGVVNGLGEWIGRQVAIVRYGEQQVQLAEQIEAQTAETLATIEKQRAASLEVARIKEQIADVQRKSADEAAKQLSITEQIALAEMKVANAQDAVAAAGADRVAAAQAELELARVRADREKLYAEQKKQEIAAEKEARKEEVEAHIAAMDRLVAQREQEEEAKVEAHMAAMDRLVAEREAAARIVPVLDDELRKLQQQGTSREQIIAQLRQQGFSEDQISAKLDEQNQKLQAQISFRRVGRGDADLSDRVLQDKISNLKRGITDIDFDVINRQYMLGFRAMLQSDLDRAQAELRDRREIRERVSMLGEEGAARFYQGDIARFEELLKRIEPETQKRTLNKLEDIEQRLAGSKLFPKRAI